MRYNFLLWMLVFLLSVGFASADLIDNIRVAYKLDSNVVDGTGNFSSSSIVGIGYTDFGIDGVSINCNGIAGSGVRAERGQFNTKTSLGTQSVWLRSNSSVTAVWPVGDGLTLPANDYAPLGISFNTGGVYYAGSGLVDSSSSTPFSGGVWHNVVITWDNGFFTGWLDGVNWANITTANDGLTAGDFMNLQCRDNWAQQFTGQIDEFYIWDRVLTNAEILELNYSFYPFSSSPSVVVNGVNLTNRSRVDYPSFLNTFNEYFVETNVTVDGVFDAGLEVNLTGAVTDVFSNYNVFLENKTLTSSNSFEFSFVDNASNIDYQIPFRFRVCRNGIVEDLSLYWNDNLTPYRVINSVIPNCASGYHEEFNLSTSASMFKNNNNISIRCSGCLGSNTIRLVNFGDGSYYKFYRKHTVGFHEFYANASNELYWFTNHAHTFLDSGVKGFNISANGTTFEFLLTVADIPPNASFFNIVSDGVDYNFSVNDSSVESGNQVRVVGDCSQEVISFKQLNITYFGNNTLIKSVNDEVINVTSTELSGNNKFVARLYCKDNDGEFTSLTRTFWANDSVNPIGNLISPSGDVNINSSAQVQFLGSDKNLFGVNLTVDCTVQGLVFSYLNTSFIGSSLFIDNVTSALTVEQDCTVSWEVCDDHTDTVFLVDKVKSDYYDKNISVSDRLILSDYSVYNVNELVFIEKKDRLSWSYSYTTYEDKFKKDKKYSYRIPKFGNGWVLRDEGTALFSSWDTKFWLDFVSKDARVDGISEDSAYFYVDVLSDSDVVTFESLGGINCVSDTFLFSVVTPAPVVPVTSIEDVSAGFSLFLLFVGVLYLGFILLGTALGVPVVAFLGLFFGFVLGIMLIPVIAWFGVSLLVLNVVMFIGFVMADY